MINKGLFTSDKNYWETPKVYFEELNTRFNFSLDACASDSDAKTEAQIKNIDRNYMYFAIKAQY